MADTADSNEIKEKVEVGTANEETEAPKRRTKAQLLHDMLISLPRRIVLLSYLFKMEIAGHPDLLDIRLTKRELTHKALTKWMNENLKLTTSPDLQYHGAKCFYIPAELKPQLNTSTGGPSGAFMYSLHKINIEPGCYMLLSAVDSAMVYLLEKVVKTVSGRRSLTSSKTSKPTLSFEILRLALETESDDPFMAIARSFANKWDAEVKTVVRVVGKKKPTNVIVYKPYDLPWPSPVPSDHGMRYIVERITEHDKKARTERGRAQYQRMKEQGRDPLSVWRSKQNKGKAKAKAKAKTEIDPLSLAIARDKKDHGHTRRLKPEDVGFNPIPYLSQVNYVNKLLSQVNNANNIVGQISARVRRFINDYANRILLLLGDNAIGAMLAANTTTITSKIALAAIRSYFTSVTCTPSSPLYNKALQSAMLIDTALQSLAIERSNNRKKTTEEEVVEEAGEEAYTESAEEEELFEDEQ